MKPTLQILTPGVYSSTFFNNVVTHYADKSLGDRSQEINLTQDLANDLIKIIGYFLIRLCKIIGQKVPKSCTIL